MNQVERFQKIQILNHHLIGIQIIVNTCAGTTFNNFKYFWALRFLSFFLRASGKNRAPDQFLMFLRLQYQCEFNETNPCFNASANVLYTEQARELAQSGGIDDVALEEMSEAEKQAELAKREAEKASQAFQKWVRIA